MKFTLYSLVICVFLTACSDSDNQRTLSSNNGRSTSQTSPESEKTTHTTPPHTPTPPKNQISASNSGELNSQKALDAEALDEYKKVFANHFTQSGESYCSEFRMTFQEKPLHYPTPTSIKAHGILEIKNVILNAISFGTSPADEENGIKWNGIMQCSYKMFRTYSKEDGLSRWEDSTQPTPVVRRLLSGGLNIRGKKENASWKLDRYSLDFDEDPPMHSLSVRFRKVDCSNIPQ